ncbi:hypothetical protein BH10PSE16_BH10PSE16_36830 [soil metagenome]
MSKYRTAYAPEFRQQLVELVHAGRSANDVTKEFGLHATTQGRSPAAKRSSMSFRTGSRSATLSIT